MEARGVRVAFWFCAGLSAAVFAAVLCLGVSLLLPLGIGLLISALLLLRSKKRLLRIAALALSGAALGFAVSYIQLSLTLLPSERLAGQTLEVRCRVTEVPQHYENSQRLTVRLLGENVPAVRCQLTIYDTELSLAPGDELAGTFRFSSARIRYGEESDTLTGRGVFLRASTREDVKLCGRWKYARLYAPLLLREQMLSLCKRAFPADAVPFQQALLLGDKRELYDDHTLHNDLTRAGLMHVAAVSGLHVSFLVGFLGLLLSNKRLLALLASVFLLLFAALTGFSPSVCRAVFMQLALLFAPLVHREADPPTSLALALAVLLCVNPCSAGSVSLQLSFAATAGILLCASPLLERLSAGLPRRGALGALLRTMLSALATSLAALVFSLPLMVWHFGSVSVVAPLTNALCLGLISFLFVGGFAAVCTTAFLPGLGQMLGGLLAWGDRFVFHIAHELSALPFAAVYTVNPAYLAWVILSYAFFALAFLLGRRKKKPMSLLRPLSISLLCLCLCLYSVEQERKREGMAVSVIDVGQGACCLLERGDAAVMIDCGGSNTLDDAGERAAVYALSRGRTGLSALVLTHLHWDHVNGVEKLLSMISVQKLYLPGRQDTEEEAGVLAAAEKYGVETVFVEREILLSAEGLELRLSPPPPYELDEPAMIAQASCGAFDVLITGDADAFLERRWQQLTGAKEIELLLVGHHGSKSSTCAELLDAIRPRCAVISVGYNSYGHPTREVLERLESRNIVTYRTDMNGTVRLRGEENGSIHEEKCRTRQR